jgi:multiple sugar transport system ATP-binding protein
MLYGRRVATVTLDRVTKRFDAVTTAVDRLDLEIGEGEFVILVGPSGCGKTTALRMIAGLEPVTSGEVRIDGDVVNDTPATHRDVAMVFQSYALYPHMSVYDNLRFPLRLKRTPRGEADRRVREVASLLSIEQLLERKPGQLSGGQRQRVAIGRALVRRPRAFLMDEPLSTLDAKLRVQMRAELSSLHRRLGVTTVYVTHDQTEAMTLGDRVVVLDKGVVQQVAPPWELYDRPANIFVAGFVGSPAMNVFPGRAVDGRLELGGRTLTLESPTPTAGRVLAGVRPEGFSLVAEDQADVVAEVRVAEQLGPELLAYCVSPDLRPVALDGADSERSAELNEAFVARFEAAARVQPGDLLPLRIDRSRLRLFDPESGRAL